MKVEATIYLFKDTQGYKTYGVVEDASNGVHICGLRDQEGKPIYFESEAYHLASWCSEYDIELKVVKREEDFDKLWEEN